MIIYNLRNLNVLAQFYPERADSRRNKEVEATYMDQRDQRAESQQRHDRQI